MLIFILGNVPSHVNVILAIAIYTDTATGSGADVEIYEWWDCVIFAREARENLKPRPLYFDLAHFTGHYIY